MTIKTWRERIGVTEDFPLTCATSVERAMSEQIADLEKENSELRGDRKLVLLKAAYDLLHKQDKSIYVLNMLGETAFYDGTDCDGYCLMEDIADELGIDSEAV